jgi:branched-chain amino acid aminotransferase
MYYNDNTVLYLDGQFTKAKDATTDLYSQTMHYGFGVFEGIRSYKTANGAKLFKGKEHYERLHRSAALLSIPLKYSVEEMEGATYEVLRLNNFENAYIRPIVICSPNMSLTHSKETSLAIEAWDWAAYLGDKRLDVMVSSFCRPHPRSTKVEAKVCGHYVNSILATSEAKDKGFDEAILLDSDGYLAEGPGSNLFFEKNNVLYTPQLGNILPGITRLTLIEICKELSITVREGVYRQNDLMNADGAFLCGTGAEIIGINSVNKNVLPKEWQKTLGFTLQKAYRLRVLELPLTSSAK